MANKKDFKSAGETAVNKFFSKPVEDKLETQTAHNTLSTLHTPTTLKETNNNSKYKDKPRINLAFDDGLLDYLHIMIRIDGGSLTKYINNLISQDKDSRNSEYQEALKLFKI